MLVTKNLRWDIILKGTYRNILYSLVAAGAAFALYQHLPIDRYDVPGFVVTTLGTALAIFLGFRNAAAYDRWWEARKIWGGIVNYSRSWARAAGSLVNPPKEEDQEWVNQWYREVVYRHIAWINALRLQLRQQKEDDLWDEGVAPFLSPGEYKWVRQRKNQATQLIKRQSESTKRALEMGWCDNFSRLELERIMNELYNLQGRAERIKNTPLGKYYDFFTLLFLEAFILILPFGILSAFTEINSPVLVFPLTVIIGWVFYIIFKVGDIKETPFDNSPYDISMTALCRTIEIDLREMLGEKELPPPVEPVRGVLD